MSTALRCCTQCLAIYRAEFTRCPTDGSALELRDDDPLIGTTIGEHYSIEAVVGEGGMGRVYRAHHTRLQRRQFAIKVLLGDLAATLATRMRFSQEADAASRLDHPNVVSVVDFGKTETGLLYLAMELVHGRTLATLIAEEAPLRVERVIALSRQMALGLAHAHGRNLVHRDFKPENVIVVDAEAGEVPRILDFGIALTHDEETSARLTTAGLMFGTPLYAAPEQARGEVVDERADQFSLGITMFEMLTGKTPHDGTAYEVIRLNAQKAVPAMASRAPVNVPPALEALVARLASRDPDDRFVSMTAVVAALDSLDLVPSDTTMPSLQTSTAETVMRAPAVPRTPRSRRPIVFAAGLALLALVASVVWFVRDESDVSHRPPTMKSDDGIATPPVAAVSAPRLEPATPPASAIQPEAEPEPSSSPSTSATPKPRVKSRARRASAESSSRPKVTTAPEIEHVGDRENQPVAMPTSPPASAPPLSTPPLPTPSAPVEPEPVVTTPTPRPVAPSRPSFALTTSSLNALTTRGSLSTVVVRRAIERAMPAVTECARRLGMIVEAPLMVRASFVIDDRRRAVNVTTSGSPSLAACVSRGLESVRTQDPPDVGTVAVSLDIRFSGGPS